MRILHISDFYHPYLGGVEQHVRTLGAALAERGHSVAVATLWREGLPEVDSDGPVRVYRLRGTMQRAAGLFSADHRRWAPPFPDPEITLALHKVLQIEQPEIVHGHDWLARSFLPLKPTSRAHFIVSLHYYSHSCAKKNLMYLAQASCTGPALPKCLACAGAHYGRAKGAVVVLGNAVWSRLEARAADKIIAVSHATARGNGITEHAECCEIIPNFLAELAPEPTDLAAYMAQLPQQSFFLFVGDLRRLKGLPVLLDAYQGLAGAPPLILIGKAWAETPGTLPANVMLLRDWPNAAVLAAWAKSFAGIVPSLWQEPFGIVVIEALSRGRPVIASRVGGIPEILKDGESGLLVPAGDAIALRAAMQRLSDDPQLYARLSRGAELRAQAFQARQVVPRIEQVYDNVLNARHPAPIQAQSSNEFE